MASAPIALALHGGAGARPGRPYKAQIAHMAGLVEAGRDRLAQGAAALEVATETIQALEASGLYVAGRGASPNAQGVFELDAAVMDGWTGEAGGVAALVGFESPIRVARAVMSDTPHVLLAGAGAAAFAQRAGAAPIVDPGLWFSPAGLDEANHAPGSDPAGGAAALGHGTVGCAVLDRDGRLAAGTSTGGVFHKLPGRVGDTPVIGAGVFANRTAAVSCTGQGEYFLRVSAAAQLAWRMRYLHQNLETAAQAALAAVADLGGDGGLIAVGADGEVTLPYRSCGMKRAALFADGRIVSAAFEL
jgi:L-asparaginase/beta-aspartyl-peptidase (threonine type)